MYLRGYSKNNIDKDTKIIVLIIEKIPKLLIDEEIKAKVSIVSKSIT